VEIFYLRSLRRQVTGLEQRLVLRRPRLRNIAVGIRRSTASRLASPGMLLVAVAVGVALEQSGHHRNWSLPNVLDATNAGLRLLLTFSSSR
jgi:hypothetical protein